MYQDQRNRLLRLRTLLADLQRELAAVDTVGLLDFEARLHLTRAAVAIERALALEQQRAHAAHAS